MENIKWLFFDIGYTLVNEDKCHSKRIKDTILKQKANGKEYSYNEIYEAMVQASSDYNQPYPTALKLLGINELEPYPKELEIPYANSKSVLKKLHTIYNIGIIANQSEGTIKRLTEYGIIKYIDSVLSSAEEGIAKPDIRFYKKALKINRCVPYEAVMIGDRLDNDIFPAKSIGMKTVWIKQGFGGMQHPKSEAYEPDYTINNINELIEIFM